LHVATTKKHINWRSISPQIFRTYASIQSMHGVISVILYIEDISDSWYANNPAISLASTFDAPSKYSRSESPNPVSILICFTCTYRVSIYAYGHGHTCTYTLALHLDISNVDPTQQIPPNAYDILHPLHMRRSGRHVCTCIT
jgi:hypothetical protein